MLTFCIVLSGCDNSTPALFDKAKGSISQLTINGLSKDELKQYSYGEIAMKYLEYFQEELPGRIAGSEKESETAVFLLSALLEMGYTEDSISVQDFAIKEGATPMQDLAEEDSISGGKISNHSQNIVVTKKGLSEKIIVVGAHYDSAGTHGIDDNGSGVSVVLESALNNISVETPYTIRYIFFGAEEIGMCGSTAYVESLSKSEKDNILFMINIDTVFAGDTCYLYGGSIEQDNTVTNDWAVQKTYQIAQNLGLDIKLPPQSNKDYPFPTGQKRSDHAPFSVVGIPYIYFESNNWDDGFPRETKEFDLIMHTKNDNLDFITTTFGDRGQKALKNYSTLLDNLLSNSFKME